jgi:phage FluMu protein Com
VTAKTLDEVRCQRCNRLLCKRSSPQPLRNGEVIEIKCWKCDDMNYLVGGPNDEAPTSSKPQTL